MEVMKIAKERFARYISQSSGDLSMLIQPLTGGALSDEVTQNVELVQFLLVSAEKVGNQQFHRATKFFSMCDDCSPITGNPLERIVYYFTEALRERINQETGKASTNGQEGSKNQPLYVEEETVKNLQPALFAWQQEVPYVQVSQFSRIQAIVDSVASAKRVHLT